MKEDVVVKYGCYGSVYFCVQGKRVFVLSSM